MAELIDKGALYEQMTEEYKKHYAGTGKGYDFTIAMQMVQNQPTTTEAEIRAMAKRELAEQIEKRIKEEVALLEQEREEAREYDDEQVIFAVNNQLRAFAYSLRVMAEQLKEE